jgi:hypothetical protein
MKNGRNAKHIKQVIRSIPLVGAIGASLLPIQPAAHQFLVLITLVWIQVFFIMECFLAGK